MKAGCSMSLVSVEKPEFLISKFQFGGRRTARVLVQ